MRGPGPNRLYALGGAAKADGFPDPVSMTVRPCIVLGFSRVSGVVHLRLKSSSESRTLENRFFISLSVPAVSTAARSDGASSPMSNMCLNSDSSALVMGASHFSWLRRVGVSGRKLAPTLCSPSNAALETNIGPTSSIGGFVVSPPDQRKWDAPIGDLA